MNGDLMIETKKGIWLALVLYIGIGVAFLTVQAIGQDREVSWPSSVRDYYMDVALGLQPGADNLHKFGRNPDLVAAAGFETVWSGGGIYTGHNATAAEIVEVFSSDVDDTSAGTGARTIKLIGLDGALVPTIETVILDGTTPVDTTNSFLRLDRMEVLTAGSSDANEGTITARQSVTTANVFAALPIGYNQTMITAYTIPAGTTGYIDAWFCSFDGMTQADVVCRMSWRELGSVFQVKEEFLLSATGDTLEKRPYRIPKGPLPAGTDVRIDADTAANNVGASAAIDVILIDD